VADPDVAAREAVHVDAASRGEAAEPAPDGAARSSKRYRSERGSGQPSGGSGAMRRGVADRVGPCAGVEPQAVEAAGRVAVPDLAPRGIEGRLGHREVAAALAAPVRR